MADWSLSKAASSQDLGSARSAEAMDILRRAQTAGAKSGKIEKAAQNFESLLVGHWLEQAEKSFAEVPGTDPDQEADSSREQFMSIACESLAQGITRSGGLGIARMVSSGLKRAADEKASNNQAEFEPANRVSGSNH